MWDNNAAILHMLTSKIFSAFGTILEIDMDLCMHTKKRSASLVCEARENFRLSLHPIQKPLHNLFECTCLRYLGSARIYTQISHAPTLHEYSKTLVEHIGILLGC